MAQQVKVILLDDIDGTEAHETVAFGIDGTSYEIDLSSANAARIRADFAQWVQAGRRVTGRRSGSGRSSGSSDAAKIREWARSQGMDVPQRGRIPAPVRDAYSAAR